MSDHQSGRLSFQALDWATAAAFLVYSSSVVVTPISLVMLARELEISLTGGGGVEGMRAALLVAALLASALVAARWGKPRSVGLSSIVLGFGLLAYAVAPGYGVILLAVAFVGAGGGVIEALLNPLVQDLHPRDSGRYLNVLNAFFSAGVLTTVLLGGELLTRGHSWRVIMTIVAVASLTTGALFLVLEKHTPFVRAHNVVDVLGHKAEILRHPRFWIFLPMMFLGGGAEGALTFWSATYIQLHFGLTPRMGGIGTACFAAGMVIGRLVSGWLVPQRLLWHLIFGSAVFGFLVTLTLPFIASIWIFLAALFCSGLAVACFWPSIQSYSIDRTPLESTSLFILLSCGGIPGFGAVSLIMGMIGDRASLNISLFVVPVLLALLAVLALLERRWRPRHTAVRAA